MIQQSTITLMVKGITQQMTTTVPNVRLDASVGEVLDGVLPSLNMQRRDRDGRELTLEARLDREGRHLHRSMRVQDVLRDRDMLTVIPKVTAGVGQAILRGCR